MKKSIGIKVKPPKKTCNDKHCPFHGTISLRGRMFRGVVVSDKSARTVTVEWKKTVKIPKYERFEKRKSKVRAHNPECINAKKGQEVVIVETRPISKTKKFVVIEAQ
jgi:small subunit ribosomal protein S17